MDDDGPTYVKTIGHPKKNNEPKRLSHKIMEWPIRKLQNSYAQKLLSMKGIASQSLLALLDIGALLQTQKLKKE